MSISLRTIARCLGLPAAALLLTAGATRAQTSPPAWTSVAAVMSSVAPNRAVTDAAGNTYVSGLLSPSTPITLGGTTLTSRGGPDGYVAKFTPAGTLVWVRQIGTPGAETCMGMAVDAAGSVYVCGSYNGTLTFGSVTLTNPGTNSRGYLLRFDAQGTAVWGQDLPAPSLADVQTNAAGEVYLIGMYNGTLTLGPYTLQSPGDSPTFLAKYSAAGALQLAVTAYYHLTGTASSFLYPQLTVAPGGEVFIYGHYLGTPRFGGTVLPTLGSADAFVAKYSAQGVFSWARQIGGTGADALRQVSVDAAGNAYATGYVTGPAIVGAATLPGAGGLDAYAVKYNAQGTPQWTQTLSGPGNESFTGNALDAAGNLYLAGTLGGTASVAGTTLTSVGPSDLVLASFSPQGTLRWTQQAGGPGGASGLFLNLDGSSQLRVMGFCQSNCQFGSQSITVAAPSIFMATTGSVTALRPAARAEPLHVYPNPARSTVQLASLPAGTPVQLHDALGRVVRTTAGPEVSVQGLAPGLYTLRATAAGGQHYAGRLLVE